MAKERKHLEESIARSLPEDGKICKTAKRRTVLSARYILSGIVFCYLGAIIWPEARDNRLLHGRMFTIRMPRNLPFLVNKKVRVQSDWPALHDIT